MAFIPKSGVNNMFGSAKELGSYYVRKIKGMDIDVYDIAEAYALSSPEYHAVKKLLCAGKRQDKTAVQDLKEAVKSIKRRIEMLEAGVTPPDMCECGDCGREIEFEANYCYNCGHANSSMPM